MEDRLREIYTRYNEELKPLIAEQEIRMSAFEEPLLLNLSKMFDYLSLALTGRGDIGKHLDGLDQVLTESVSQSYMYVATAIKEDIKQFEKNNGGSIRIKLEKGTFAACYENLKKDIKNIDKRCKKNKGNYLLHLNDYKESYQKCMQLENRIEEVNGTETLLHSSGKSWLWTAVGWIMSIFASLWAGKYAVAFIKSVLIR